MSATNSIQSDIPAVGDHVQYANELLQRVLDLFPDLEQTEFVLLRGLHFELVDGKVFAVYVSRQTQERELFHIVHRRDLREFRRKYGLEYVAPTNTDQRYTT